MHYVYLLQSLNQEHIYIGNTDNLERRLKDHNEGKNSSTVKYLPFRLVYYEAYSDKTDAISRERRLKHHGSVIGHLKKRLRKSLIKY